MVVWLAVGLVGVKAYYLGLPAGEVSAWRDFLRDLMAITYVDILFVAVIWAFGYAVVAILGGHPRVSRIFLHALLSLSAFCCLYAVAGVVIFWIFGGFLTYPLLALIGDVRMIRSSVGAYMTLRVVAGLIAVPFCYMVLALGTARWRALATRSVLAPVACAVGLVWIISGHAIYKAEWPNRSDRRVAENAHWVLVTSWWRSVMGDGAVQIGDAVRPEDIVEFESRQAVGASRQIAVRRLPAEKSVAVTAARRRPMNVILVVLESVGTRWTSFGGLYDTTPSLLAESSHALVFDNFYAHVGRSSNSLAAILLSEYPKLGFRDLTSEYPRLSGTSLAQQFHARGYRTAFMTPSDLEWAGWDAFLAGRGFDAIEDYRNLSCSQPISSWGVEDRCVVERIMKSTERERDRPFFVMAWTTQTHHPYEPTPNVPVLNFNREPIDDSYDLGRYLNVLHETDRHLARLFESVRRSGLADNTLVVVTGDHGQAFGYPHSSYMQGRFLYEEDVHVPLMIWSPRLYRSATHASTIGGHVDLAPTITELAGLEPATDWKGRSLLDPAHPPRAYFYVAEDSFTLGVREDRWKYSIDLRDGTEELYDLSRDPSEQHNLWREEPERCARLRQRLAAWAEADRKRYEHPSVSD
jgi:arylsulfatase A-like enzyme